MSDYIENSIEPEVVADWINEVYWVAGSPVDAWDDLLTHSISSLSTMINSSGELVYAPHNYIQHTDDFRNSVNSNWTESGCSVTVNGTTPEGYTAFEVTEDSSASSVHRVEDTNNGDQPPTPTHFCVTFKRGTGSRNLLFKVQTTGNITYLSGADGTVMAGSSGTEVSVTDLGSGWFRTVFSSAAGTPNDIYIGCADSTPTGTYNGDGSSSMIFGGVSSGAWPRDVTFVETQGATAFAPRIGHHRWNGSSWVDKGIRLETEARTNLLSESEDPGDDVLSDDIIYTTGADDWSGGTTAVALRTNTNNSAHFWVTDTNVAFSSGTTYCYSVDIKPQGSQRYIGLYYNTAAFPDNGRRVTFDFDGTPHVDTTEGSVAGYIVAIADGWYRCTLVATADASTTTSFGVYFRSTGGAVGANSYVGSTSDGCDMCFHQIEAGLLPSSYIPTSGSTATRAAETLVVGNANITGNTSAVSFAMEGEIDYADEGAAAQQVFMRWFTDANNYFTIDLDTDGADTGEVNANQAESGTLDTVESTASLTAGLNEAYKIAMRNTSGAINLALDGTAETANTTPTALEDASAADLAIGYDYMGTVALFRQWEADIGDAGIASATSLLTAYSITAEAGSYTVTGTATSFSRDYQIVAGAGSYAVSGTDASLDYGFTLVADNGSYAITGTDTGFLYGYLIDAGNGSYTITGTDATLAAPISVMAETGAYLITGTDISFVLDYIYAVNSGSYLITGTDATLTVTAAETFVFEVDQGSYTVTGTEVALSYGAVISAGAGSYTVTGTAAGVYQGYAVDVVTGSYLITGTDVGHIYTRIFDGLESGSYEITGGTVILKHRFRIRSDSSTSAGTIRGATSTATQTIRGSSF